MLSVGTKAMISAHLFIATYRMYKSEDVFDKLACQYSSRRGNNFNSVPVQLRICGGDQGVKHTREDDGECVS